MKCVRQQFLFTVLAAVVVVAGAVTYDQCKDPLYQTHWAGKSDIPTLTSLPTVQTNLLKCRMYNTRASCCHQGFEPEQSKYYEFWRQALFQKLWRANAHRISVLAVGIDAAQQGAQRIDLEQLEVVKSRYQDVLSPASQKDCFSKILTYVAGMLCFSCKPNWYQYTVISVNVFADRVQRVRMARQVCLELWDVCASFGRSVTRLQAALQDSKIAKKANRSEENLAMFMSQQQLCEWAHDEIALHPFKLPTKEDQISTQRRLTVQNFDEAQGAQATQRTVQKLEFDVFEEGRASTFARIWQGMPISKATQYLVWPSFVAVWAWLSHLICG